MSALIVVTRNVSDRLRGFLASTMLQVSAGVFIGVRLNRGVRDRVLAVVEEWFEAEADASVVAAWPDPSAVGGIGLFTLGTSNVALEEICGLVLARRQPPARPESREPVL